MVEPCLLPSDCDKIMKLVGSCSSLVAKFCSENVKKSDELCRLLAMAILIDTANFSPNQTIDDIDREQYSELTNQLQDWDKDSVYKKVKMAIKSNLESFLNIEDSCLRVYSLCCIGTANLEYARKCLYEIL